MTYTVCDDAAVAASHGAAGRAWLNFSGRLVAKALLDGTHLDAEMSQVLLKHVCGAPLGLDDLQDLDVQLWRSLKQLTEIDVTDLALTFAVRGAARRLFRVSLRGRLAAAASPQ